MIPIILQEVTTHHWMSTEDLSNLIGIAEMTPGPLGVNCATFAGTQTAGILGGIAAVLGVLSPAVMLTLPVAIFFHKFRKSTIMEQLMRMIKPICIAMILKAGITLGRQNLFSEAGKVDCYSVMICLIGLYLIHYRKWSVSKVILIAAILGVGCFGML